MNDLPEASPSQTTPSTNNSEGLASAVPTLEQPPATSIEIRLSYILAFAGLSAIYILMFIVGGELRNFAIAGLNAVPFIILVVLAYGAQLKTGWIKNLALGYWIILAGATGFVAMLFTIAAVALPSIEIPSTVDPITVQTAHIEPLSLEQALRIVTAIVALTGAGLVSLACFLPAIRRNAARFLDIDPHSFVHAAALATSVAITLMCLIPLLAVNGPPLLPLLERSGPATFPDPDEQLRITLYSLIWAVPASFLAVGCPIRRTFSEARERLALKWPSLLQIVFAVVMVGGLLLGMSQLNAGIEQLWKAQGWRATDERAIELLFGFAAGPVGALILGVVAGLGEELVFRGVLQPRLGILLPALMFTSVHALQYDFDALVQVLLIGLVLGLIRKRTNTTTCVLIHSGYDIALFLTTAHQG
jgi:uncharacterized protein